MPQQPLSPEILAETAEAVRVHGGVSAAASALNISRPTLQHRWSLARHGGYHKAKEIQAEPVPEKARELDELLAARRREYERHETHYKALRGIPVTINKSGPIGILHFGDPHLDDPGTNIALVERYLALVNDIDGLYASCIGDITNNWVGKLEKLYAKQETTDDEAVKLARWFMSQTPWLFVVSGNHDAWNRGFVWLKMAGERRETLLAADALRVLLRFPNGREIRINARHVHRGNSQWNAGHGTMKAAQIGDRDHIVVGGHTHSSAEGIIAHDDPDEPEGRLLSHCVQLGAFKRWDSYAVTEGYKDKHIAPACLTVIDPAAKRATGVVEKFWDVEHGADYLRWRRGK